MPGGKYYQAAVKAARDIAIKVESLSIGIHKSPVDTSYLKYSMKPILDEDLQAPQALSPSASQPNNNTSSSEGGTKGGIQLSSQDSLGASGSQDSVSQVSSDAHGAEGAAGGEKVEVVSIQDEVDRLQQQIRLLLPADDHYFADGHIFKYKYIASVLGLCGFSTGQHEKRKERQRWAWVITLTNQLHAMGVALWAAMMTPVLIQYIIELYDIGEKECAIWATVLLAMGWVSLVTFQLLNQIAINPRFKSTDKDDWSKEFVRLYLTENRRPRRLWWLQGDWNTLTSVQKIRVYFRMAIFFEGAAIIFIFATTLVSSWGHMHRQANCVLIRAT